MLRRGNYLGDLRVVAETDIAATVLGLQPGERIGYERGGPRRRNLIGPAARGRREATSTKVEMTGSSATTSSDHARHHCACPSSRTTLVAPRFAIRFSSASLTISSMERTTPGRGLPKRLKYRRRRARQ